MHKKNLQYETFFLTENYQRKNLQKLKKKNVQKLKKKKCTETKLQVQNKNK